MTFLKQKKTQQQQQNPPQQPLTTTTIPKQQPKEMSKDPKEVPKVNAINRLKSKDSTPVVNKSPRRQRSSRFHVSEKVELEKLPGFKGTTPSE